MSIIIKKKIRTPLAKKDNKKQDVKKTRSSLDQNISLKKKKKVIEEKIKKPKIKKNDQAKLVNRS